MLRFGAGIAIGASLSFPVLLTATEAENQVGSLLVVNWVHCALLWATAAAAVLSFITYEGGGRHHAAHCFAQAH